MLAPARRGSPGHAADGAEQDRVVLLDRGEVVVGQHVAGLEVARRAERERRLLERDVGCRRRRRRAP